MKTLLARARLAAFGALLFGSACATARESAIQEPLPFHLALLPTEVHDTSASTPRPEARDSADRDDMRLVLDSAQVSPVLAAELASAFARTTLLAPPDDAAAFARLSDGERELYWQERARAAGADLLLRARLLLDPAIDEERNEKFWLNLPLFLLGGPMCYFVGDRSYHVAARLQGEIFEVSSVHLELEDFALLTIPLYVEAGEQDLRFLDRADGAGHYLASLLVPAGLLARQTARIEAQLEERLPRSLGHALAAKIFAGRAELERSPVLGGFQLDGRALRTTALADGLTKVAIPVQELPGTELLRYELRDGERLLASGEFAPRMAGEPRWIEAELELPVDAPFLRVQLVDAQANTRGYTLPLVPARR